MLVSVASRPGSAHRFSATGPLVVVGRSSAATLRLPDEGISGRHLALRWDATLGRYRARDLDSTNGTRLNGDPLPREGTSLSPGDRLGLGRIELLVVAQSPPPDRRRPNGPAAASRDDGAGRKRSSRAALPPWKRPAAPSGGVRALAALALDGALLSGMLAALALSLWLLLG